MNYKGGDTAHKEFIKPEDSGNMDRIAFQDAPSLYERPREDPDPGREGRQLFTFVSEA
jgi:hypothetical protein